MMNIIIVGGGVVGTSLAEQLSLERHRIVVIDSDRAIIRHINESLDVLGICGSGASPAILERAGIKGADMVLAVTTSDEVNLVVGMIANGYGVEHCIARIRNTEYSAEGSVISLEKLGLDHIVNPEPFIVQALHRMLSMPGTYDFATLAGGEVEMFGFHLSNDSPAIGKSMAALRELGSLNAFLILYITRAGEVIVPRGDDILQEGDSVHVLAAHKTVPFLVPIMHPQHHATDHVIIFGATRIGLALAQAIEDKVSHVALLEADPERATEAANLLKKTVVLCGSATDLSVLEEASIDRCDLFCALSEDGQQNMLSCLLAKKNGAEHTAAIIYDPEYASVVDSLGVDIVLNPRLVVVGEIMRHIRRGNVLSVTRFVDGQGELIEMIVPESSAITKHPLKKIKFPEQALLGAIVSNHEMKIPNGDTQVMAGDRVMVYALPSAIPKIEKLFDSKKR